MEFYHFNRQENEVFQILLYALKNNKTQVELPSTIDGDNLIRFYKYAISFSENPFISPYEIRYHYFNHRTYLQTVPLFPYLDRKKKMEFDKEFQYVVNGIQGIASTPYFQAKAAYLYLLQTVSYNSENPKVCHSAWGALMDGKAVCEGISYAYAFLLNKMRIPCGIVNGDCSLMGGAHAWNLLKLDGDYYHVDVTWGLTSDQGSRDNFNYFMLTDDEISCNHSWDKKYIPSCRSYRYNFFTQNDSYATSKIPCVLG